MSAKLGPRRSERPTSTRSGRKRPGIVARRASGVIYWANATTQTFASHLPGMLHATRVRANATTSALQILPDSTLRGLAATSAGLGAGFYLAGVPRLVTAAAMAPAMVIGAAILLRPGDHVTAPQGAR
jgi:hypothetical protein